MAAGVIRLIRTPLIEGEVVYGIGEIFVGVYTDGYLKGQDLPRPTRLPTVLADGRLLWELPDNEQNRKLAQRFLPTTESPRFSFSVEYPEDVKEEVQSEPVIPPTPDPQFADPDAQVTGEASQGSEAEAEQAKAAKRNGKSK
jgi:hypothetical protein